MTRLLLYYLLAVNLLTFATYGIDKYKARHARWRVREVCFCSLPLSAAA